MSSSDKKSPHRLHPLWEGRRLLTVTGLLLTLGLAALLASQPRFIQKMELGLYDALLSQNASPPKTAVPVLVGIDEESLQAYGQWPWPRYRLALLVRRLQEMGAEVVALDILMPEPDRTSPEVIKAERERDFADSPAASPAVQQDSNSERLAGALAGGKSVLGYYFGFSREQEGMTTESSLPPGLALENWLATPPAWPRPSGVLRSMPALTAATGSEGFINAQHDTDGVLRRIPLLMRYRGSYYPSFALAAVLQGSASKRVQLIQTRSGTALVWQNVRIPIDSAGNLLIDFRSGKESFRYIPAREILGAEPAAGSLRGKIVVVGVRAGGVADIHQVPSGLPLNGLAVQATVIDNILSGSFISRPDWARAAELCVVLGLGVLTTWLLSSSGFVLALLAVVAGTGGCYLGGRELLQTWGIFLSPVMPMLTPVVVMTVLSSLKYAIEARKVTQRNRDLFEAQDAIIISMSVLGETRDSDMGGHVLRTKQYVATLARQLATLPRYRELDEASIDLLAKSAPLHDIGKVGIPDSILHKAGPLTDGEYDLMKSHTLIGASAITKAIKQSARPESLDFLNYARQMIESHHEKWDGSGYPHGLRGTDIPLAGRLMALADVYDALVCKRVYKRRFSHAEAQEIILAKAGEHFDPEVIAAFTAKNEEFLRISQQFADLETAGEEDAASQRLAVATGETADIVERLTRASTSS